MQSLLGPLPSSLVASLIKLGLPKGQVNDSTAASRSFSSVCTSKLGSDLPDLLSKMVTYLPENRQDAQTYLQHPYFARADQSRTRRMNDISKVLSKYPRLSELITSIMEGKMALDEVLSSDLGRLLSDVVSVTMKSFVEVLMAIATDEEKERLLMALYIILRDTVDERVDAIKSWLMSQSRVDDSLSGMLESVEKREAAASRVEKRVCESCLAIIAPVHRDFITRGVDDLRMLNSSIVNELLSSLSLTLQDTTINSTAKSTLLERIFIYVGIPNPLGNGNGSNDYISILSPASKSLILHMRMVDNGMERVPIVTTRETTLMDVCDVLRSSILSRMRRASMVYTTPLGAIPVLVPYFRSAYGKKVVQGATVEEGEGLGPRKELFNLISVQLQQSWALMLPPNGGPDVSSSAEAGSSTVDCQGAEHVAVGYQLVVKLVVGPTPESSTGRNMCTFMVMHYILAWYLTHVLVDLLLLWFVCS